MKQQHTPNMQASPMISKKRSRLIHQLTTFLGSSSDTSSANETRRKNTNYSDIFSQNAVCSVPSLSIVSTETDNFGDSPEEKYKAEEFALANLARPIFAGNLELIADGEYQMENADRCSFHTLSTHLRNNMTESFLVLINARLRAYIMILARYGINLSSDAYLKEDHESLLEIEMKLQTLIDVGNGITIENLAISFDIEEEESSQGSSSSNKTCTEIPLLMKVSADVLIPCLNNMTKVNIESSSQAVIKAFFTNDFELLERVDMEINAHALLSSLIDRASCVIAEALESVKTICALPPNSSSIENFENEFRDESNGSITKSEVISRDTPATYSIPSPTEDLKSEGSKRKINEGVSGDEIIEKLSPQSCASIVDSVIGKADWRKNDDIIIQKSKRQRI